MACVQKRPLEDDDEDSVEVIEIPAQSHLVKRNRELSSSDEGSEHDKRKVNNQTCTPAPIDEFKPMRLLEEKSPPRNSDNEYVKSF